MLDSLRGVSVDNTYLRLGSSRVFYDASNRHSSLNFVKGGGPYLVDDGVHLGNPLKK